MFFADSTVNFPRMKFWKAYICESPTEYREIFIEMNRALGHFCVQETFLFLSNRRDRETSPEL